MSSFQFDRSAYYASLRRHNDRLDDAILARRRADYHHQASDELWRTLGQFGLGTRAHRVYDAVSQSEAIALSELRAKLGGIALADIWPVLRGICHDVALYAGGGALVGGMIGGGAGALAFGIGAVPGATVGATLGAQGGNMLLGFLGLKSVLAFMLDSLPRVARAYEEGFRLSWGRMPDLSSYSADSPGYCVDDQWASTYQASHAFARGHEILIIALLAGIVAYLGRGKGQLPALLAEVRQSARLGPKVAGWLEQNADRLSRHPPLQERAKGAGNGALPSASAGQAPQSRPRSTVKLPRPAEPSGQLLRDAAQVVGKSEGGPGLWQLSPKRTGGEVYQEQITGVQRGIEYDVPCAGVPSGKVSFDGYDAERKVLLDAKDWRGYPLKDTVFWQEDLLKQARNQINASGGIPIEWHVSTKEGQVAIGRVFADERIEEIELVLTPNR
ncbi:hypothetical protein H3H36_11545 [Duganella sp. FT3S]|uniref:Tox-REase-5 domain-containing protein n=1 Tax=Rugamonas fusca TaxID=2758568 RepID=A0A7W2EHF8_9BURK|nr:Tox-REase-5 domain-containing protein [Rugamonas fusca]MBA5605994.1 hypothetical protein [Rugamonas fusca]